MLITATTNTGSTALVDINTEDQNTLRRLAEYLGGLLLHITLGAAGVSHDPTGSARIKIEMNILWGEFTLDVALLLPATSLEFKEEVAIAARKAANKYAITALLTQPEGQPSVTTPAQGRLTAEVSVNSKPTTMLTTEAIGQPITVQLLTPPTDVISKWTPAGPAQETNVSKTESGIITAAILAASDSIPQPRRGTPRHFKATRPARHVAKRT